MFTDRPFDHEAVARLASPDEANAAVTSAGFISGSRRRSRRPLDRRFLRDEVSVVGRLDPGRRRVADKRF